MSHIQLSLLLVQPFQLELLLRNNLLINYSKYLSLLYNILLHIKIISTVFGNSPTFHKHGGPIVPSGQAPWATGARPFPLATICAQSHYRKYFGAQRRNPIPTKLVYTPYKWSIHGSRPTSLSTNTPAFLAGASQRTHGRADVALVATCRRPAMAAARSGGACTG